MAGGGEGAACHCLRLHTAHYCTGEESYTCGLGGHFLAVVWKWRTLAWWGIEHEPDRRAGMKTPVALETAVWNGGLLSPAYSLCLGVPCLCICPAPLPTTALVLVGPVGAIPFLSLLQESALTSLGRYFHCSHFPLLEGRRRQDMPTLAMSGGVETLCLLLNTMEEEDCRCHLSIWYTSPLFLSLNITCCLR